MLTRVDLKVTFPFAIFLCCFECSLLHAAQLHVGKSYPFRTLHEAVAQAHAGDTVLVHSGTYDEGNLTVNKPLTIMGDGMPVLDGEFKDELISVKSSYVSISGLKLINTGFSSMDDLAAIRVYGAHHVRIFNNEAENAFFGFYFTNSTHCIVEGNRLKGPKREQHNVGNGIHMWKCANMLIRKNHITGQRDGIYFEFVRNTSIVENHSEANMRYGLHFMFSDSDSYVGNAFVNNGSGVAVMYSKQVNMVRNTFLQNWGSAAYGLLLKDIRDSHIIRNTFERNTVGINAEGCSRSMFFANRFVSNGYAVRLQSNCDDNRLSYNNFTLNTFDLVTNGFTVLNELSRNYWDRYSGFDLSRDGVGDQPYRPMSMFSAIIENSPVTVIFLKSFLADLLDLLEKVIPGLTPESLLDEQPLMSGYKG
jgi:nitrous oxidase accessory protein